MGTRNLTCVYLDGEYRVAQYGQWDGYPSGQGLTALNFLRGADLDAFAAKVRASKQIDEAIVQQRWQECGLPRGAMGATMDVAERMKEKYPQFSRDTAAAVLALIAASPDGIELQNRLDFAADSLFCEWAYVIDLDAQRFEVYKGFNRTPLREGDRFFFLQREGEEYAPVRLLLSVPLSNLPSDDDFVTACEAEGAAGDLARAALRAE